MKSKILSIGYWVLLFVLLSLLIGQLVSEGFDGIRSINGRGTYLVHQEEQIPREYVNKMILEDGKIHLFYYGSELVNVYTTAGEFLYGIQFPEGRNGRSDMYCADGLLYVDARLSGIYVFDGTDLLRFEAESGKNEGYAELKKLFTGEYSQSDGEYTYSYLTDTNKIVRTGNDTTEDVIQFPQRRSHYSLMLLLLAVVLLLGQRYGDKECAPREPERLK